MKRALCLTVILALLAGFVVVPGYAQQDDRCPSLWMGGGSSDDKIPDESLPPGELMIFDALVLRPLGLVAMAVGLGGAFVTGPFAATSNSGDRVGKQLLEKPAYYTFCRPIGEVDD